MHIELEMDAGKLGSAAVRLKSNTLPPQLLHRLQEQSVRTADIQYSACRNYSTEPSAAKMLSALWADWALATN